MSHRSICWVLPIVACLTPAALSGAPATAPATAQTPGKSSEVWAGALLEAQAACFTLSTSFRTAPELVITNADNSRILPAQVGQAIRLDLMVEGGWEAYKAGWEAAPAPPALRLVEDAGGDTLLNDNPFEPPSRVHTFRYTAIGPGTMTLHFDLVSPGGLDGALCLQRRVMGRFCVTLDITQPERGPGPELQWREAVGGLQTAFEVWPVEWWGADPIRLRLYVRNVSVTSVDVLDWRADPDGLEVVGSRSGGALLADYGRPLDYDDVVTIRPGETWVFETTARLTSVMVRWRFWDTLELGLVHGQARFSLGEREGHAIQEALIASLVRVDGTEMSLARPRVTRVWSGVALVMLPGTPVFGSNPPLVEREAP